MERGKHIVFILGDYLNSANGLCVKKIIDVMKQTNKVTVVCTRNQKGQPDIEEYNSHTIIRIEAWEHSIRNQIRDVFQNPSKKTKRALYSVLLRGVQVRRYLNALISKENVINAFVEEYVKALNNIKEPIDFLVPVCFPFESVVAALSYQELYNDSVKVVPYLFDKFSTSRTLHRTTWNRRLKMRRHLILEKIMLEDSEHILTTGDWEKHFKSYFSNYIEKITFSDIPALCPIVNKSLVHYEKNRIHFVYTGALNNKIRTPEYTLRLFSSCMDEEQDFVFHMYVRGNCDSIVNRYVNKKPQQIINHGSVPVEIAHSAFNATDFLISIGNTDITQQPSKIYEYMASGKPIIHLYQDKRDPTIKILSKYAMSCCVEQNEIDFENNKAIIMRFVDKYYGAPTIKFEEVKEHFIEATPEYTAQILTNIIR